MFLISCLILACMCIGLSVMLYRSWLTPMGIYSIVWIVLVGLHAVVSASNDWIYFELENETKMIVLLAWVFWLIGCLIGSMEFRQPQQPGQLGRMVDERRLRSLLLVLITLSSGALLFSLLNLYQQGVLFEPGDAWRDAHFVKSNEVFSGALFFNLMVSGSLAATYAATAIGIYAVIRHRFHLGFAVLPVLFGLAYDLTIAGRFWITQAPVLIGVAASINIIRFQWVPPLRRGKARKLAVPVQMEHKNRPQKSLFQRLRLILIATLICLIGLWTISQLRVGVKRMGDTGIKIGGFEVSGVAVGPMLYATDSLALLNAYTIMGHDWGRTNGKLALGGVFYTLNIPTSRIINWDVGGIVSRFSDQTNERMTVGPQRVTVFFATYLLPATTDFGQLGVVAYSLIFSLVCTLIYKSAKAENSLFAFWLYPISAVWVAMTAMRWELISPMPWAAILMVLMGDFWVTRRTKR
jgi:hypothetical protein